MQNMLIVWDYWSKLIGCTTHTVFEPAFFDLLREISLCKSSDNSVSRIWYDGFEQVQICKDESGFALS